MHLSFPSPKTPPPIERVDSGRNVNVSVNIADFLKPRAATTKESSSSSSEEESSDSSEGEYNPQQILILTVLSGN